MTACTGTKALYKKVVKLGHAALQKTSERTHPMTSVEEMDAAELRTELKAIGISTAVKAVGKLREMLRREREKRLN
ncbi:hypothetical protein HPB48_014761 [Haemaphysalis longicornis]|uniref:LEM domain-containing protein n=1 Tax=Haemaphysalis longicornis TaxID=44386 RepID=A0A9J6FWK6_HAELO|nr:hypothetical protein HPB48_014761 [Haemaphysalis longicornis]